MKESMGLVPTMGIIIFALVLISGYLAFTINYSKAYKANSRIVNIIQKYDNKMSDSATRKKIEEEIKTYLEEINYTASDLYTKTCANDGYTAVTSTGKGWCYKIISSGEGIADRAANKDKDTERVYVKVKTYISIDVPIFNKIFSNLRFFSVDGATKPVLQQ